MVVVADSGPVIVLAAIGHFDLLRDLYGAVLVPAQVHEEVVVGGKGRPGSDELGSADWVSVESVDGSDPMFGGLRVTLDEGEAAALVLAVRLKADLVLIDELRGRQTARKMGLAVKGTLGVLITAKRAGLISAVAPLLDELVDHGFWVSEELHERVLEAVGEDA